MMHVYKHSNPSIVVADPKLLPLLHSSNSYGVTKYSLLSFPSLHSFILRFYLIRQRNAIFFHRKSVKIYSDDIRIELIELPLQVDRLVRPKDFKDMNHPMMTVVSLWRRIW